MKTMDSIISRHNCNILNPKQISFGRNCRNKDSYPLNGESLTQKVVYRGDVTNEANNDQRFYLGQTQLLRSAITTVSKMSRTSNINITRDQQNLKFKK